MYFLKCINQLCFLAVSVTCLKFCLELLKQEAVLFH